MQFIAPDLAKLEDSVSAGSDLKILALPDDMSVTAADNKIFELQNNNVDQLTSIAQSEFEKNRLRTYLKDSDLEKVMKKQTVITDRDEALDGFTRQARYFQRTETRFSEMRPVYT